MTKRKSEAEAKAIAKDVRNWRVLKIAMCLLGAGVSIYGIIVFIQSILENPLSNLWKFSGGIVYIIIGALVAKKIWNFTFQDYLKEKKIR